MSDIARTFLVKFVLLARETAESGSSKLVCCSAPVFNVEIVMPSSALTVGG